MVSDALALGPITAKDLIEADDSGNEPAEFLSSTMPWRATSRARFWCSGVHTSFGPSLPYCWLIGLPSKNPNLIIVAKLFDKALSTVVSLSRPRPIALLTLRRRKLPQSRSNPALANENCANKEKKLSEKIYATAISLTHHMTMCSD